MAKYTVLEFNREVFLQELQDKLTNALDKAIDIAFVHEYFNGDKEKSINFLQSEWHLTFSDLRAWVLEFGKGIYIDTDNPYLLDYINSDLWARGRTSGGMVLRGRQPYKQIDYEDGQMKTFIGANPQGKMLNENWQEQHSEKPKPFIDDLFDKVWETFLPLADKAIQEMEDNKGLYFITVTKTI